MRIVKIRKKFKATEEIVSTWKTKTHQNSLETEERLNSLHIWQGLEVARHQVEIPDLKTERN